MERETEMEIKYFIKEKKNGNVKSLSKTASLTQEFRKNQNTGHAKQGK
jgi:hypothetical protein